MWLYDPLPILHAYRALWLSCLVAVLTSCTPVKLQPVASNCLPIPTYDHAFQNSFADELGSMHTTGLYPHVETFVIDAVQTRQGLKACK